MAEYEKSMIRKRTIAGMLAAKAEEEGAGQPRGHQLNSNKVKALKAKELYKKRFKRQSNMQTIRNKRNHIL